MKLKVFHEGEWRQYPAKVFTEHGWQEFTPRNVSGIKRIWRQPAPPPPGTHYAWEGERHASASVRLDGDGNETARNLVTNPRGRRTSASGVPADYSPDSGATLTYSAEYDAMRISGEGSTVGAFIFNFIDAPGSALAWVYNSGPETVELATTDGRASDRTYHAVPPGEHLVPGVIGTGNRNFYAILSRGPIPNGIYFRSALFAGEYNGDFFDGSTPSDRAHDLWYNQNGVPHEWVNGQGWTPTH